MGGAQSWALVLCTYRRADVLLRCIGLALGQTRPPSRVVVVDASPDWEATRERVRALVTDRAPDLPLVYVPAERPSSTHQRNTGVELASEDVVFLIDDDSLMYPDCAEEVMRVYETDLDRTIQGVSPIQVPFPPDVPRTSNEDATDPMAAHAEPRQSALRRAVKALLRTESTYFLPYDAQVPRHPAPRGVDPDSIGIIEVMTGCTMTFRRSAVLRERFAEVLVRYAAGEDQDLSYRVSRHGPIVNAVRARICHLGAAGGRLSHYTVTVVAALNPAVLQRIHSPDIDRVSHQWNEILRKRMVIGLLKDLSARRWSLPTVRGVRRARTLLPEVRRRSPRELETWYPAVQADLVARDRTSA